MPVKLTITETLRAYYNHKHKLIQKRHESCKNHELIQCVNFEKDENACPYEIHIKCLKGHNLLDVNVNCCEDYELTDEDFSWKLNILENLARYEVESRKRKKNEVRI